MIYVRRVVGTSMLPTYDEGQVVVALKALRKPKLNDVVIIIHDGREKIKRITDMGGGKVYVRGDNPRHSTDSRHFGWVGISNVKGKIVWPIGKRVRQKFPK